MESYGILSAPKVELLVKSDENCKAIITPIINCIKGINKTTEKVYRDDSGARNIIRFVQNGEEKKVLLLLSEESTEAYSINRKWCGEALLFRKNEKGNIALDCGNYEVYKLETDQYESLKERTEKTGKASSGDKKDCWEKGAFSDGKAFKEYFE